MAAKPLVSNENEFEASHGWYRVQQNPAIWIWDVFAHLSSFNICLQRNFFAAIFFANHQVPDEYKLHSFGRPSDHFPLQNWSSPICHPFQIGIANILMVG
jgi:hypothetical protein